MTEMNEVAETSVRRRTVLWCSILRKVQFFATVTFSNNCEHEVLERVHIAIALCSVLYAK